MTLAPQQHTAPGSAIGAVARQHSPRNEPGQGETGPIGETGPLDGQAPADDLGQMTLTQLQSASLPTQVAALEALAEAVTSTDPATETQVYSGPQLGRASVAVHHVSDRLHAKRLQWQLAEEADGRWAATGSARTYPTHTARTHHISHTRAKNQLRLARQLRDHIPAFAAALHQGKVGLEHTQVMANGALTSPERIAALHQPLGDNLPGTHPRQNSGAESPHQPPPTVEEFLLHQAQRLRLEDFRRLVAYFAKVADPDADERGYRDASEREFFDIAKTLDGYHLAGFLTDEHGQLLKTALQALLTPPAPDDTRTRSQRRAQALADMAHILLNKGLTGSHASVRPHLGVLIGPEQFAQMMKNAGVDIKENAGVDIKDQADSGADLGGTAFQKPPPRPEPHTWSDILNTPPATWTDGTGPVPTPLLRRLATCGEVYRILFSPENEVINHGRAHRTFTSAQRRALIARDRHCTYPGCSAPPSLCESHHARVSWADDGPTDLANGALLCFHHHDLVDAKNITMTRQDGRWHFHTRHGIPITNLPTPWEQRE